MTALAVALARKIWRNALKRLNPRPELRRPLRLSWTLARQSRTSPPTGAGLEPRRIALFARLRGRGFRLPRRQATVARKIWRNALKRLNPRPESRQPLWLARTPARQSRTSPPAGAGLEPRRIALLVRLRARGFRLPHRQATLARKIWRNALKRLNPRPECRRPLLLSWTLARQSRTSPLTGAGLEPRLIALLFRLRGWGFRLPGRQATLARKIRRNALKRLNPRPELRRPLRLARTRARQSRTSPPAGAGFQKRRMASPLSPGAGACGLRPGGRRLPGKSGATPWKG